MRIILQIRLAVGIWFALTLLFPYASQSAEVVQKIRIGVPSLALTYMPFYVAQEKGFLAKAGLEAEYIQMNTGIQQFFYADTYHEFPFVSIRVALEPRTSRGKRDWF